jgi:hypothetical protein
MQSQPIIETPATLPPTKVPERLHKPIQAKAGFFSMTLSLIAIDLLNSIQCDFNGNSYRLSIEKIKQILIDLLEEYEHIDPKIWISKP